MLHGKGVDWATVNNNGHHRKSKFDNEDEYRHLHINTFQTFLVHEQILNK
jgi:hypothetical protein